MSSSSVNHTNTGGDKADPWAVTDLDINFATTMVIVGCVCFVLAVFFVVCMIRYPSYGDPDKLGSKFKKNSLSASSLQTLESRLEQRSAKRCTFLGDGDGDGDTGSGGGNENMDRLEKLTALPAGQAAFRPPPLRLPTPGGAAPSGRLPPLQAALVSAPANVGGLAAGGDGTGAAMAGPKHSSSSGPDLLILDHADDLDSLEASVVHLDNVHKNSGHLIKVSDQSQVRHGPLRHTNSWQDEAAEVASVGQ